MDVADIPGVPDWVPDHLREQGIEELYPPQAEAVEAGVTEGESLVASIPTASGKTLVAALAMLASIDREGKALYIVPLRALASEKEAEFAEFEQYGLDVGVSTGNYESEGGWLADKDIVVATSEKVDSLVRNDAPWLDDLSCVVADEVHLVDDGQRGPTLEVTLAKLRSLNSRLQTVALSATIGNADVLADWLDAELVDSDWRPIDLQKGVHYGDALHLEDGSQSRVSVKSSEDQTAAIVRDTLIDETRGFAEKKVREQKQSILNAIGEFDSSREDYRRAVKDELENLCVDSLQYHIGEEFGILGLALSREPESAKETAFRFSESTNEILSLSDKRRLKTLSEKIEKTEDSQDLDELSEIVNSGVAFYYETLPIEVRKYIKNAADNGVLKSIVSTVPIDIRAVKQSDIVSEGGSSLVFVNSRKNAEAAARRLGGTTEAFLSGEERQQLAEVAAEIRDVSDTETSDDLADAVEQGAAFHHAGLAREHRSLVEEAFRDRLLKVVSATPTLAAGVNTPSRRVVVRDWRRYDGNVGGMQPLSVLEVHQMMGRAGRPGLDPYGEAVLVASSHDELDELFERYVWADPEPVQSKLAAEPALRTHILATVASNFARSREGLLDFLEGTLYAEQTGDRQRLEDVTDNVIRYLVRNDFLTREGDELSPTSLGHTVSRLYLDPMSAAEIIDGLRAASRDSGPSAGDVNAESDSDSTDTADDTFQTASELREQAERATADDPPELTALGLYHLVARTPDMYELYLRSGDEETYTEIAYERENELLGRAPSEYEDRFDDWLSALKTARLLEDWASEEDEETITDRYGVGPGDIRGKVETAQWLLGAAESLVGELDVDAVPAIREARTRVEHGVRGELVELAGVRGVGRKRARRLFEAGIESRPDLREADKSVVLAALRGREKTAENVLENAGHRDPSMDGVEPAEGVSYEGDSGETGDDDAAADGGGRETTEDQSNLGDF